MTFWIISRSKAINELHPHIIILQLVDPIALLAPTLSSDLNLQLMTLFTANIVGVPLPYEVLVSGRAVIIDHDDAEIEYAQSNSWVSDGSLHTMTSKTNFASFSYEFTGNAISVIATTQDGLGGRANATYTLQCLLDGQNISEIYPRTTIAEKSVVICTSFYTLPNLSQGRHSLVVNFSWGSNYDVPPIGIDYLLVGVDSEGPLELTGHSVIFQANDPLLFSNLDSGYFTETAGTEIIFPFVGVSVTWNGNFRPGTRWTPYKQSGLPVPATYTVDDGDPQPFDTVPESLAVLNGSPPDYEIYLMQKLFQTPSYPYGNHTLRVIFHGNNTITPLTLDNLVVQATSVKHASPTISPFPAQTGGSLGTHDTNAIVAGSVSGGTVAFIIAFVVLFLLRRRSRGRQQTESHIRTSETPDPFVTDMGRPMEHRGPRKARLSQHGLENPLMQELQDPLATKWARHLRGQRRARRMSEPSLATPQWVTATGLELPLGNTTFQLPRAPEISAVERRRPL